ncbi:MAG: ABC transporter substrate-binding protein [Chloroflexi bacterium]|nr:ABC transporter substrate-binding protein [Chloroflexota bacterium]
MRLVACLGRLLVAPTLLLAACAAPATPAPSATSPPVAATAQPAAPTVAPTPLPRVSLKTAVIGSPSDAGLYIAEERGYFREQGIDNEFVFFDTGARIPPALGTEQVQVGGGALSAGFFNAVGQNIRLKVVADKGLVANGWGFEGLMVRKDLLDSGQVRTVADLRGRKVAHAAEANGTHWMLDLIMRSGGLSDRDLDLVTMPFPDMVSALGNRSIEAAMYLEPNGVRAEDLGVGVRWISGDQVYPNFQLATLWYSESFAQQPDLGRRFMVAYLRGIRDYNDAFVRNRNRDEVVAMIAKHATVKDPELYTRMRAPKLHPDGLFNLDSYRDEYQWYLDRGYIRNPLDPMSIVDDSFRQAAVAELGAAAE